MPDETLDKIDRFFNVVDAAIEETSHLLTRGQKTGKVIDRAKAERQARQVIDVDPRDVRPAPSAVARTSKVRIIESIDAETGRPVFVVTDGANRSECVSRDHAERVKHALETP